MLKTLFCLSAVAFLATSGAYAEDAQNDAKEQSTEQALADCRCGKTSKKGKEGSEGDKGNKELVAHCDSEDGHTHEEEQGEGIHLSCGGCRE